MGYAQSDFLNHSSNVLICENYIKENISMNTLLLWISQVTLILLQHICDGGYLDKIVTISLNADLRVMVVLS